MVWCGVGRGEGQTDGHKGLDAGRGGARRQSQHSAGRGRQISEFEASLVYKVRSRTARATQRHPVSKQTHKQQQNTKK